MNRGRKYSTSLTKVSNAQTLIFPVFIVYSLADFKYNSLEGYVAKEEMPEYLSNLFRAKRPL
jgi:hypothetical protein